MAKSTTRNARQMQLVSIPSLHPKQQLIYDDIIDNNRRRTVVLAGRRFGKTKLAAALAMEFAINRGKVVWWVAPSHKLMQPMWQEMKAIVGNLATEKSEEQNTLYFTYRRPDGSEPRGQLVYKTASDPDMLRGAGIDLLIMDEAAFCDPEVWKVTQPALTDKKGLAVFISTPKGRNWLHKLYQTGLNDKFTNWKSWHFTSYDNPFIDPAELEETKATMSEVEFREEHMAEFVDDQSAVFMGVDRVAVAQPAQHPEPGHIYSIGIDWGRKADSTVICVIDITAMTQVRVINFTGTEWSMQVKRVLAEYERWHPVRSVIESNSAGQVVIEALEKAGMRGIEAFYTSATSKPAVIEGLSMALQKEQLMILNPDSSKDAKIQYDELRAYELKATRAGGWSYGAPIGLHDDSVIALALALHGAHALGAKINMVENPFYNAALLPYSSRRRKQNGFLEDLRRNHGRNKFLEY